MSLEDKLSNLSIYDAKKYFRKAQNVVFNYTEIESKVREATNNEPWGASSTLMEQISQGTYNIREREEILGMIFRRFTEKTGSEWRQIYKALQLLDYLIKHGAERFIDEVRTSISLLKLLQSFHYIDSQGRDQGVNVRSKAQSLVELLSDDAQIRTERKKARETSKKYQGVAGGTSVISQSGLAMNPRAGLTSSSHRGISVSADFDSDEEYDAPGGFKDTPEPQARVSISKDPEDLFSFDTTAKNKETNSIKFDSTAPETTNNENDDDDDFSEFQSAVPQNHSQQTTNHDTLNDLLLGESSYHSNPGPQPVIAAQQKKEDPFSSLFTTAKADDSKTASKTTTDTLQPLSATNATKEIDEDVFGDFTSAQQPQPASTNLSKDNKGPGEIDLLSF